MNKTPRYHGESAEIGRAPCAARREVEEDTDGRAGAEGGGAAGRAARARARRVGERAPLAFRAERGGRGVEALVIRGDRRGAFSRAERIVRAVDLKINNAFINRVSIPEKNKKIIRSC